MSAVIYFDTLAFVETLEEAGVPEKQAKAFAKAQQEALSESLDSTLATKADFYVLKQEIQDVRTELKQEIQDVRAEVHEVKSDVNVLKWMMGFMMTGVGALILKAFF